MVGFDWGFASGLAQIIRLDVAPSGDNALVIGMGLATVIRIACALAATFLHEIAWVKFLGGLAVPWGAGRFCEDARKMNAGRAAPQAAPGAAAVDATGASGASGASDGLDGSDGRSILLMAFRATLIRRVLARRSWISHAGVAAPVCVGGEMIWSGGGDMMGLIDMGGI